MKKSWEQELKTKIEILLQLPNAEGALMPMLTDFISSLLLQARKEAREETLREVINILNYPGADADYNVQKIFDLLNEQEARRLCDVDTCEGHNQYEVITW